MTTFEKTDTRPRLGTMRVTAVMTGDDVEEFGDATMAELFDELAAALTPKPYADEALHLLRSRLGSPLPLPYGQKQAPPIHWTGWEAPYVTEREVVQWIEHQGGDNLCLRVADGVLGIDVDAYRDKVGAETLAAFEEQYGQLPATVVSTSRDDGVSGIRLYRVAAGARWPSSMGRDVEVIHPGHRYAVWQGSRHPEGMTYLLGDQRTGEGSVPPPDLDALPCLTARQQQGLQALLSGQEKALGASYEGEPYDGLSDAARASVDRYVSQRVKTHLDDLQAAQNWPDGHLDDLGRGWEKLTADKAQTFRVLLAEGWSGLDADTLKRRFLEAAPTCPAGCREKHQHWTRRHAEEKWQNQAGRPIKGKGSDRPARVRPDRGPG